MADQKSGALSVEDQISEQEAKPMTADEKKFFDAALASLPKEQQTKFASVPLDVLLIVRGFANEEHRMEETLKAIQHIAEWRDKVGYYDFFEKNLEGDSQFHKLWPEYICGTDKYGHFVQGIQIGQIDTDELLKLDEEQLLRLQGQKMKAYAVYKQDLSKASGVQRYKHTMIVDLHNISMSMLMGKKKNLIKKIFDIGSTYYPETMFKIYLINAPMVFRAIWAVIKPWLHPITVAKVNILGSSKEALKKFEVDGLPAAQVPKWLGGTYEPVLCFDYISRLIAEKRAHSS